MGYNSTMRDRVLTEMAALAESTNLPPKPEPHAKARADVQARFDDLFRLAPQIQGALSALSVKLTGNDIPDPGAVDRMAVEIGDLAASLGRAAEGLRTSVKKFTAAKR